MTPWPTGSDRLHLQISSDDAHILAWPWEALHDPETGWLTQTCRLERRLNRVRDPHPLPPDLPRDRVNILLVTARPYDDDVQYRSMSRPLVELVADQQLPAHVHVLRPPTFDRLRAHLTERPNTYHILHFDGHGAYRRDPAATRHALSGREGRLIFEDDDGRPDPITAEQAS